MADITITMHELAAAAGATYARVRKTEGLKVEESVRQNCLVNYCGKSGKSWTCPPYTGELAELEARLHSYPNALIIQNVTAIEDSWDFEGMTEAANAHNRMIRAIASQITEKYPDLEIFAFGCGSCDFCEQCTCPNAPCRFPDKAMSSVEAQGLDINALVTSVGLSYINGVNTVSYVGMILWR